MIFILKKIMAFCVANWRVILMASMVLVIYFQNASHKATKREFAIFKAETVLAGKAYVESLRIKDEFYAKQRVEVLAHRDEKYKALNLDREKIRKALNEKVNSNGSLHDALRVYQNRVALSETRKNGYYEKPPETERDCHGTTIELAKAGQSCALDYKALYDDVKAYESTHNTE